MDSITRQASDKDRRRTPRYDIHAPVRFRTGSDSWHDATSVNIGATGMLMRTSDQVPPRSVPVQFQIALEVDHLRAGKCVAACTGRVVWTRPSTTGGEALVALTIEDSELLPATASGGGPH